MEKRNGLIQTLPVPGLFGVRSQDSGAFGALFCSIGLP